MLVGLIEPKIRHRPAQARSKSYAQLVAHGPLALRPFPDAEHPSAQTTERERKETRGGASYEVMQAGAAHGFLDAEHPSA